MKKTIDSIKDHVQRFGKYEGYTLEEMFFADSKYCEWLLDQEWYINNSMNKDDIAYLSYQLHAIVKEGYSL